MRTEIIKWIVGILFCLMFCYMFLDRFLFERKLDDIVFIRPLRRLSSFVSRLADRLEGGGCRRTAIIEKNVSEATGADDLVPRPRQSPPKSAMTDETGRMPDGALTFGTAKPAQEVAGLPLPELFAGRRRISFPRNTVEEIDTETETDGFVDGQVGPQARSGGLQGIGMRELSWIIDLCNGKPVPAGRRKSVEVAVRNIMGTQIHASLIESINGSDDRISRFLDDAERRSDDAE